MVLLVGVSPLVKPLLFRWDLTDDKRYSLSEPTKELLRSLDGPLEVEILLEGKKMNPSFKNLREATVRTVDQMGDYAKVKRLKASEYELPAPCRHTAPLRTDRVAFARSGRLWHARE